MPNKLSKATKCVDIFVFSVKQRIASIYDCLRSPIFYLLERKTIWATNLREFRFFCQAMNLSMIVLETQIVFLNLIKRKNNLSNKLFWYFRLLRQTVHLSLIVLKPELLFWNLIKRKSNLRNKIFWNFRFLCQAMHQNLILLKAKIVFCFFVF